MDYSHPDAELIRQPAGYWTWAAYNAIVTRTRTALAELGTTQPQWWTLNQLATTPKPRTEVADLLRNYLDTGPETMESEIDATLAQGWTTETPDGLLSLTPEGRTFYEKAAAVQSALWTERHADISDADYLTTLKVLQRFIHNTGGSAWHH